MFSMRIPKLLLNASVFFFITVSISSARFYKVSSFQQNELSRNIKVRHHLGAENTTAEALKYFPNYYMPTLQPLTLQDLRVKPATHDDDITYPKTTMSDGLLVDTHWDHLAYPETATADDFKVKPVNPPNQFAHWRTTEAEDPQQDVVLLGHLMEGKRYAGQRWWNFFQGHDFDRNKMLDGCELAKTLSHSHEAGIAAERRSAEIKMYTDREIEQIVDPILKVYDTNYDGFVDTLEYAVQIVEMDGVIM